MTKTHMKKIEDIQNSLNLIFSKTLEIFYYTIGIRIKTILSHQEYMIFMNNGKLFQVYLDVEDLENLSEPISEPPVDAVFRKVVSDEEIKIYFNTLYHFSYSFPELLEYPRDVIENE